ncbi:MAG: 5'-nucleotidase C-terminal domain-containing protein [Candidatus Wallbacteria bacterium]|nr:5'-nucleotidase C-terminal domain-containing protein [Candidatus Wallbacteria bacterium]
MNRAGFLLVFFCSVVLLNAETFYIAHTNDFHSFLFRDGICPPARVAQLVKTLNRHGQCFYFDAGDFLSGSFYGNYFKGRSIAKVYSYMPLTFATFGNHEFDYADPGISELFQKFHLPAVSTNVDTSEDFPYCRFGVFTIGTKKMGVLGLTTPDTAFLANPEALKNFRFRDPTHSARDIIKVLKMKGCDFIVCLSHLGYEDDLRLAGDCPDLDLIIGGHTHTVLERPVRVGTTTIVQAGCHGHYLGVLRVELDETVTVSGGLMPLDRRTGEDPLIRELCDSIDDEAGAALGETICRLERPLTGENVRMGETLIGNLITDALRISAGAEIALINAGGIRTGLPSGDVTGKDLYNCLPFNNKAVFLKLSVSQLTDAIRHGVSAFTGSDSGGRFPLVSGMSYSARVDLGKVTEIKLYKDGKPLPDKEYLVVIPDFLAGGGDGYSMFRDMKTVYAQASDREIRELVLEYLQSRSSFNVEPDGRINVQTAAL